MIVKLGWFLPLAASFGRNRDGAVDALAMVQARGGGGSGGHTLLNRLLGPLFTLIILTASALTSKHSPHWELDGHK